MRFLAYIKNDILGPSFADILIKKKMIKNWKDMKILDLGSGPCYKEEDKRFRGVDITCVDIFKNSLKRCKKLGYKIIHADIRKTVEESPDNSYDIIWAFDILEHLTKRDAIKVLGHMERIAKRQIVISIPEGDYPQDANILEDGNIYQEHKSTWKAADFKKRGYEVEVLKDLNQDIRSQSKSLSKMKKPVTASQMWVVKTFNER